MKRRLTWMLALILLGHAQEFKADQKYAQYTYFNADDPAKEYIGKSPDMLFKEIPDNFSSVDMKLMTPTENTLNLADASEKPFKSMNDRLKQASLYEFQMTSSQQQILSPSGRTGYGQPKPTYSSISAAFGSNLQSGVFNIANDQSGILTSNYYTSCYDTNYSGCPPRSFNPTTSSTWISASTCSAVSNPWVTYSTQPYGSQCGTDQVCLGGVGGLCVENMFITVVSNFEYNYDYNTVFTLDEFSRLNGQIGLGRPSQSPACFLAQAFSQNQIASTTYAFKPNQTNPYGGTFLLGGYKEEDIQFLSLQWLSSPLSTEQDAWITGISSLTFSYLDWVWLNTDVLASTTTQVRFVTGYNYIGLDNTTYYNLCNAMQNADTSKYVSCGPDWDTMVSSIYFSGGCSEPSGWMLSFNFGSNVNFTISFENLVSYDGSGGCWYFFQNIGHTHDTQVILGTPFIQQFYTIFDDQNQRIGLAISQNTNQIDGPWIDLPMYQNYLDKANDPAPFAQDANDPVNTYYAIQGAVGYPPQTATFVLSNDMPGVMVTDPNCACAGDCCCNPAQWFDSANSSTWQAGGLSSFSNQFVQVESNLGQDKVCLGSGEQLCVNNVTVSSVTSYCNPYGGTTDFALNEFFLDGTFGLSRSSYTDETSFIAQALAQGLITNTVWSIQPIRQNSAGILIIGGFDQSQIVSGSLQWIDSPVNLTYPENWYTSISQVSFNGQQVLSNQTSVTQIVTGFNYIGFDAVTFANICNQIAQSNILYSPVSCGSANTVPSANGYCSDLNLDWKLTFQLSVTSNFTISGYSLAQSLAGGKCYFAIMNTQSTYWNGSNVILGQPFISQFYTIFDSVNQRVGLGLKVLYSAVAGPQINVLVPIPPVTTSKTYPIQRALSTDNYYYYNSNDPYNIYYGISSTIGNPKQSFFFVLSNDLPGIMVATSGCWCGTTGQYTCTPQRGLYQPSNSLLYQSIGTTSFTNQYVSFNASTGLDKVCLGNLCVGNVTVLQVSDYCFPFGSTSDFELNEFTQNGVFGLSRTDSGNGNSFLAQAQAQGYINETTWALEPSSTNQAGTILIGGYDETQIQAGSLQWLSSPINSTYPENWYTSVTDVTMNGQSVLYSGTTLIQFVTGFNYIGFDSVTFANICNEIAYLNTWVASFSCGSANQTPSAQVGCSQLDLNWYLTFQVSPTQNFTISGQSLAQDQGGYACYFAIMNTQSAYWGGSNVLLGQPFLSQFYTIFDSSNEQVGLGLSTQTTTIQKGPWINQLIPSPQPAPIPQILTLTQGSNQTSFTTSNVQLGSPFFNTSPQIGQFQFTNDQAGIYTPYLGNCTGCPSSGFFNPSKSMSWVQNYNLSTGDMNLEKNATVGTETVCVGGIEGFCVNSVKNTQLVTNYVWLSPNSAFDDFRFNGTFALGRTDFSPHCFLNEAYNQNYINSTTYAFQPNSTYNQAGTTIIGGFDQTAVNGSLAWVSSPVNVTSEYSLWYTDVQTVNISGRVVFTQTSTSNITAAFKNGYPYVGLNSDLWSQACEVIQLYNTNFETSATGIQCNSTASPLIVGNDTCSNFSANWTFSIQLSTDAVFTMSAQNFSFDTTENGLPICFWYLQDIGPSSPVVLGQQFFKQFYTVFDSAAAQIGIGISMNSLTTSVDGPWITYGYVPNPPSPIPQPPKPNVLAIVGLTTGALLIIGLVILVVLKCIKARKKKEYGLVANDDENLQVQDNSVVNQPQLDRTGVDNGFKQQPAEFVPLGVPIIRPSINDEVQFGAPVLLKERN